MNGTPLKIFTKAFEEIMRSVRTSLSRADSNQIENMVKMMLEAQKKRILVVGVGRSGLLTYLGR